MKNPEHLEFWLNQSVDVYLVVRDAEETIRWMNITRYLKERGNTQNWQIVFNGEKLEAREVWRIRDEIFSR